MIAPIRHDPYYAALVLDSFLHSITKHKTRNLNDISRYPKNP